LRILAVATFIAVLIGTASAAEVYRFVDKSAALATAFEVNGLVKRALNPIRSQEIFELPPQNGTATLYFAIGQEPVAVPGSVSFDVELERGGNWLPLYQKEMSQPGWIEERITLPADLGKARLRFRRRLISGPVERAQKSAFGDPVLIPAVTEKRPSVILISLDTLRADRLGLAGNKGARTPVLDAFARSGIWYTQAYSPSAWTLPSHASLLYGLSLAGIPHRKLYPPPTDPPPKEVSIAEVLRAAGYLTAAFTGGGYLAPNFGFDRGFDTYFAFPQPNVTPGTCVPERFDGPEVFQRGTEWLRERGQAPFFLFLHTYDVHDRCPFQRTTNGRQALAWDDLDAEGYTRLLSYYDDLIAEADARVGALLSEIDRLGLRDNTVVIITSDHGELFNEHGKRGHGCMTLYDGLIRVPLLIRYPARLAPRAPGRDPVGLVDVAPTILELVGVKQPDSMTGAPLPGVGAGEGGTRPVLVSCDDEIAVRQGELKLIASKANAGTRQLFNIANDPAENENVMEGQKEQARSMLNLVEEHAKISDAPTPAETPREIDAETKERLRALGYEP
jgi:arylsulfatase A-like enzyme